MNISYLHKLPNEVLFLVFMDVDIISFKKYRATAKSPLLLKNYTFFFTILLIGSIVISNSISLIHETGVKQ